VGAGERLISWRGFVSGPYSRPAASKSLQHEQELELRTVAEERETLFNEDAGDLGEPFSVLATPADLVETLLLRVGLRESQDASALVT
jgi:hypothetical protein